MSVTAPPRTAVEITSQPDVWPRARGSLGLTAEVTPPAAVCEAAVTWTEAYPAVEYRHGTIGDTGPGRPAGILDPARSDSLGNRHA
ncbi:MULTISPECIES: hypothetical protein [Streptomyces]|uniref:Uncharacterized protein n=1 Tax=Streptomyces salyersiae TaxID=3075530 RepID=A0ABU2RQN9_9ACTN|nr:hypothetical protein [Streptomyces sp. DSM 41770]MDT0431165.1 hypothetical protein [Streptomyces sp. DSM 41770]